MSNQGRPPIDRFWAFVRLDHERYGQDVDFQTIRASAGWPDDDHWPWRGALNTNYGKSPDGYGTFDHQQAHRWAYEHWVGPIPDGLIIDHVCRVTNCVNPAHLEPVTYLENARRGIAARGPGMADPFGHRSREVEYA